MALAPSLHAKFSGFYPVASLARVLAWLAPAAIAPTRCQSQLHSLNHLAAAPVPWVPSPNQPTALAAPLISGSLFVATRSNATDTMPKKTPVIKKRLPLRIWHQTGTAQNGVAAHRMVISGRISEVCAELERMAAAEVRQH